VDGIKGVIAGMVANSSFEVRPTAIYANPVLLDLIDRELKSEFKRGALDHGDHRRTSREKPCPHRPETATRSRVGLGLHGNTGKRDGGASSLHRKRSLIEHHWLTDGNPRVFQLGLQGSLASQMVVVKFGGVVVKGASYAHYEVK